MNLGAVFDALKSVNLHGLRLIAKDRQLAREYVSQSVQRYRELMEEGLPSRNPLKYLEELGSRIPLYRIATTTLAWTTAQELRKLPAQLT